MKFTRMLLISRPLAWLLTVLAYLIGIMHVSRFSIIAGLELILLTMPFNFFLYGINDIYDIKSDSKNDRKGGIQGAKLRKKEIKEVKKYAYSFAGIFLFVAALSYDLVHFLVALIFTVLCFAYSHPLFRFKSIPFADSIVSSIGYMLPVLLSISLFEDIFTLYYQYALLVIPFIGIHAISTLPDYKDDKKNKINTIGVFLGKRNTVYFSLLTFIIGLYFYSFNTVLLLMLVTSIVWCVVLLTQKKPKDFDRFAFGVFCVMASFVFMTMLYFILQNL